jgi:hypothetical protein
MPFRHADGIQRYEVVTISPAIDALISRAAPACSALADAAIAEESKLTDVYIRIGLPESTAPT